MSEPNATYTTDPTSPTPLPAVALDRIINIANDLGGHVLKISDPEEAGMLINWGNDMPLLMLHPIEHKRTILVLMFDAPDGARQGIANYPATTDETDVADVDESDHAACTHCNDPHCNGLCVFGNDDPRR